MRFNPSIAIVVFLLAGSTFFWTTPGFVSSANGASPGFQKLGFGFVGDPNLLTGTGYSPSTFYQGMYQTPPYPSVSEMNIADAGHWSSSGSQQFIDSVGSLLGSNQYLMIELGMKTLTDSGNFASYMNHLGGQSWKSHLIVGVDGEHTNKSLAQTSFVSWENVITSNGIRAINRYGAGLGGAGAGYSFIANTNWPFAGYQSTAMGNGVGIMVGLSVDAPFPSPGCGPSGNASPTNGYPGWSLVPYSQGYLSSFPGSYACLQDWPATIPYVLSVNNGAGGEFIMFNAGYADSCWYFLCPSPSVGASGLTTNANWDNLQFRGAISQWLATNSNDYITGNSQPPPTSTSSTQSSRSTTTSASSSTRSSTTSTSLSTSMSSISTLTSASSTSTNSGSTSVASSTSTTTTTTTQVIRTTSTVQSPNYHILSVVGGCPSTGAGSYIDGSTATVEFMGVCNRSGGSGMRVTAWSLDGGPNTSVLTYGTWSISVPMNKPHTVRLFTLDQYQLTLDYGAQATLLSITHPTIPGDDEWYDSRANVTFVGMTELQGFTSAGWALDSAPPTLFSGGRAVTASFLMIGPHTLHVLLAPTTSNCSSSNCSNSPSSDITIQTNTNQPGGVWVDGAYYPRSVIFAWTIGSVHNITAPEGYRQSGVRSYFRGWSGELVSRSRTIMLSVNKSEILTADYSKQYLVSFSFTDASGQSLTPQAVTVVGPSGTQTIPANLSTWVDPGSQYRLTSVIWLNWNVARSNDSSFQVAQPTTLGFVTNVYVQTIQVSDVYNLPIRGASVNVTTLNGVSLSFLTDSNGVARFRVPSGLFSATVSYLGVDSRIVSGSEGSHGYNVSYLLSYPLLATVVVVSLIAVGFAALRLRKKPGAEIFFFS